MRKGSHTHVCACLCMVCKKVVMPSPRLVHARNVSGEEGCEGEEGCDTCVSGAPVLGEVEQVLKPEVQVCHPPQTPYILV